MCPVGSSGAQVAVHIRWRGGKTQSITVDKPRPIALVRKTLPQVGQLPAALLGAHSKPRWAKVIVPSRGSTTNASVAFSIDERSRLAPRTQCHPHCDNRVGQHHWVDAGPHGHTARQMA
jgi:hypothetical protein